MKQVINQLNCKGVNISNEVLMRLAPYWTEHINRFGMLPLDMDKVAVELEYTLSI